MPNADRFTLKWQVVTSYEFTGTNAELRAAVDFGSKVFADFAETSEILPEEVDDALIYAERNLYPTRVRRITECRPSVE